MADTPGSVGNCALAEFSEKLFKRFEEGRKPFIEKCNRNLTDFRGEWRNLFWKANDGQDWRSRAVAGIARQKATTAFTILIDLAIGNGRIRFGMEPSRALQSQDVNAVETYRQDLEDAEDVITDQFDRCHADRHMIKNMWSLVTMGCTFAKFARRKFTDPGWLPLSAPDIDDMSSIPSDSVQWEQITNEESGNAWEWVSNFDMFCDPEFGMDPRSGCGVIQRRMVSARELRTIAKGKFFIQSEIDAVIQATRDKAGKADNSDESQLPPAQRDISDRQRNIRHLEMWIYAPRKKVEAFERRIQGQSEGYTLPQVGVTDNDEDGDDVFCLINMGDDRITRVVRVEPSENPFFRAVCEQHPDEPLPHGVVDNAQAAHEGTSKALRAIEDNINWCNNPVFARIRRMFRNMPDVIEPGATYDLDDAQTDDARKALAQIKMDPMISELISLMQLWEKYGDWDTFLAKITQGQVEKNQATATEITEQAERGDKYTASVMRNLDDGLTEPMGTRFFTENMRDPSITKGKGDFRFKAQGWEAQQTRVARIHALQTLLSVVMQNEAFQAEIKPRGFIEPMIENASIDKASILKTDEEKQADAQAEAQSEERQVALEAQKADVAKTRAEAARAEADADSKRAGIVRGEEQSKRESVKTIANAEAQFREPVNKP